MRLRQEDYHQDQASLGYIVSSNLGSRVRRCLSSRQHKIVPDARKWKHTWTERADPAATGEAERGRSRELRDLRTAQLKTIQGEREQGMTGRKETDLKVGSVGLI